MDFFEAQEVARKRTKLLVFYFVLAILGIVVAVYGLLLAITTFAGEPSPEGVVVFNPWQPTLLLIAAVGSLAVILLGSGFKVLQLASGGARVAQELGGRRISTDTTDPEERRLLNVVEEMAIASGTPVPDVYLLEHEEGINAFAAGYSPSDAVIGVTRGCMRRLSRDELQGVIAHEFSHVLNGDMRLNIRLMGLLFGIVMLTILGRIILRSGAYSSSNRKDAGTAVVLFGVGLLVIGSIGAFFARLIQAAVSRQREFLADASAVQFTRMPDGIAGALKKIGGLTEGSRIQDPHAEEASHMFFADGMVRALGSAMATHPPLPARIRAIDPHWDGRYLAPDEEDEGPSRRRREPSRGPAVGRSSAAAAVAGFAPGAASAPVSAIPAFREPTDTQIADAARLHAELPEAWVEGVRRPAGAQATLLALLLSRDPALRDEQVRLLEGIEDDGTAKAASVRQEQMGELSSQKKLVLIDLAMPALRRLSPREYDTFRERMRAVVESDHRIDLFEFTLEKILARHLDIYFRRRPRPQVRFTRLRDVSDAAEILLSALARVGSRGDAAALTVAFGAGAAALQAQEPGLRLTLRSEAHCGLGAVGAALDRLEEAGPLLKRALIDACSRVVLADGQVLSQEAELIRAIADALGTPLPLRLQVDEPAAPPVARPLA
ncbi:MAG: M48 family metallopeptidase [Myxococcales bacterium]|nr:M48 family metallopeptidase [Myxococcales bacterium]